MSDQVKFVGVHREREREEWGVYIYVGSSKIRASTYRESIIPKLGTYKLKTSVTLLNMDGFSKFKNWETEKN